MSVLEANVQNKCIDVNTDEFVNIYEKAKDDTTLYDLWYYSASIESESVSEL